MELRNKIFRAAFEWLCQNKDVKGQADLARRTGIGENTISNILNGKNQVRDRTIRRLNEAFDNVFNIQWLRGEDTKYMLAADVPQGQIEGETPTKIYTPEQAFSVALDAKQETIEAMRKEIFAKEQVISMLRAKITELESKALENHPHSYPTTVNDI